MNFRSSPRRRGSAVSVPAAESLGGGRIACFQSTPGLLALQLLASLRGRVIIAFLIWPAPLEAGVRYRIPLTMGSRGYRLARVGSGREVVTSGLECFEMPGSSDEGVGIYLE